MVKVTAIFDIGKTNKKFFLFNDSYEIVHSISREFALTEDEDGFPCDDLEAITLWAKETFFKALESETFDIKSLNFSTYGASLVHIDKNGKVLAPLYNYTKDIDQHYIDDLYNKYGGLGEISTATGSPPSGMLNSGIQLFWLKQHRPDIYEKIEYSLHLPQYMSYLFTNIPTSDYTSTGCHTMLWDYKNKDYHTWVRAENIDKKLASIEKSDKTYNVDFNGKSINIGIGIHDSSAALVPYSKIETNSFLLISTGTWAVTLNPFYKEYLTEEDLESNCLNYMNPKGNAVRASRLFLGNEYKVQVNKLNVYFKMDDDYHKSIPFSKEIHGRIKEGTLPKFKFEFSNDCIDITSTKNTYHEFPNYEVAYHHLVFELINELYTSILIAKGKTEIETIFVDGGFVYNKVFMNLLLFQLAGFNLMTASCAQGSALGAALTMNNSEINVQQLEIVLNLSKLIL